MHGPYYYRFFWGGGKLVKRYVRLGDVETVRAACDRKQKRERAERAQGRRDRSLMRDMKRRLRDIEGLIKLALEVTG